MVLVASSAATRSQTDAALIEVGLAGFSVGGFSFCVQSIQLMASEHSSWVHRRFVSTCASSVVGIVKQLAAGCAFSSRTVVPVF
jgi:hypothetical protein